MLQMLLFRYFQNLISASYRLGQKHSLFPRATNSRKLQNNWVCNSFYETEKGSFCRMRLYLFSYAKTFCKNLDFFICILIFYHFYVYMLISHSFRNKLQVKRSCYKFLQIFNSWKIAKTKVTARSRFSK